jgi:acid phosphatase
VNSANLQAGDVVFFKSGGIWRERLVPQSGAAGAPIIYAAYGSGPQPIISGGDIVPNSGWSVASGSIYQITLANAPATIWDLYVDGGVGAAAQNALGSDSMWGLLSAACVSSCSPSATTYIGGMQRGSWFYSNPTLYVWLGDGSSPASHAVEIVTRDSAIGGTVSSGVAPSHIVLDDLNLQRAGEGVSFYAPGVASYGDIVMRNLTVLQTGTGQVDAKYLNGLDLEGAINATYDSNVISYTGAHGNGINNQRTDNAVIVNNDVSHTDHNSIDIKASDNVTIQNNKVHDAILGPTGAGLGPNVNNSHLNGIYDESVSADGRSGSGTSGSYPAQNLTVEQNIISNIGLGGTAGTGVGIQIDRYLGGGNKIYNNTIFEVQIGLGAYSGSGSINNNAIHMISNWAMELTPGYTEDFNDLGMLTGGGTASISGQSAGAHDFAADPLFIGPTATPPNFGLQPSSPCIYAGTDVGLPFVPPAPDLGAIDSTKSGNATPTPTGVPTSSSTLVPTLTPTSTPTAAPTQAAVITLPETGATVSGTVPISVQVKSSSVSWVNLLVDGVYLASSPPFMFNWNSTTVSNGGHIIEADAYATGKILLGTDSINVSVNNIGVSPTPTKTPVATPSPSSSATAHPTTTATLTPTSKATPTPTATSKATPTPTATATLAFSNVVVVLEENHSLSDVLGNSSMPYFNSLISKYALATQYYADTHPSLPNYLWLTSGSADGISADVCGVTVSNDNIVREMAGAGVSWKSYQEDLPAVGYLGCSSGNYAEKHNPFAYFSDVQNNSVQLDNMVPFTEFATDLAGGTLPRFSFITPNLQDDAHDGTLAQADSWLQSNLAPLLLTPMFQPGGSGLLIIVFDEGDDNTNGGGQVPWVAIGPRVKSGYRSVTFYQHQSTLRLILKGLGVTTFPGAAATAPDMTEFFQ